MHKILVTAGQVLLVLAVSAWIAYYFGPSIYIGGGTFMFLLCAVMTAGRLLAHSAATCEEMSLPDVYYAFATAFIFGVIWPTVPVIFFVEDYRERARLRGGT